MENFPYYRCSGILEHIEQAVSASLCWALMRYNQRRLSNYFSALPVLVVQVQVCQIHLAQLNLTSPPLKISKLPLNVIASLWNQLSYNGVKCEVIVRSSANYDNYVNSIFGILFLAMCLLFLLFSLSRVMLYWFIRYYCCLCLFVFLVCLVSTQSSNRLWAQDASKQIQMRYVFFVFIDVL